MSSRWSIRRAVNAVTSIKWTTRPTLSWHGHLLLISSFQRSECLPPKLTLVTPEKFSLFSFLPREAYTASRLHTSAASSLRRPIVLGARCSPLCVSLVLSNFSSAQSSISKRSLSQEAEESQAMGDLTEEPMRSFQIVVAATLENGIGKDGVIPWTLPSDMKFFKRITTETAAVGKKNAVVMGRNTWLSVPAKFRPLPGRLNVILSRTLTSNDFPEGSNVLVCGSLYGALEILARPQCAVAIETVYVIGGGQVFGEAMVSPLCDAIHVTEIESDFRCDAFCPAVDLNSFAQWYSSGPTLENGIRHSYVTFLRKKGNNQINGIEKNRDSIGAENHPPSKTSVKMNELPESSVSFLPEFIRHRHEEYQYLHLIKDIIETGNVKGDRTGTGTISKFGCQMRFNLRKSFPLLTTKRVHWRGILEELLWFISGSTNAKILQDKGIKIWNGNSSKEYLDSLGLKDREEGDVGPIYGFQWRHFGAKYIDMHANYSGQGFDQLADVIHKIRTNPDDRRIMLSAWNPADLHLMALPPCHMFAQFYVANGELSCQMYQRSCDMGLGVPYNIASYSLLTCIVAYVCDLVPGDFVHVLGDAHVYKNHVEPLQTQLKNTPKPFPMLRIKSSATRDIDSITANDFELIGYESSEKIAMPMAV